MKYHALFVIFLKSRKILNCRLLQNIGDALRVNIDFVVVAHFIVRIETKEG